VRDQRDLFTGFFEVTYDRAGFHGIAFGHRARAQAAPARRHDYPLDDGQVLSLEGGLL
jgi:hypothetical protein